MLTSTLCTAPSLEALEAEEKASLAKIRGEINGPFWLMRMRMYDWQNNHYLGRVTASDLEPEPIPGVDGQFIEFIAA